MTDKEKAIVMAYTGKCMLTGDKLSVFYEYVESIMGRPVYTHEMAIKAVDEEIKEKSKADFIALCADESSSENPNKWLPITKRPMTEDEKSWHESCYDEAEILDCPLPEDGEDVLITVNGITWIDTFIRDEADGCYFESYDIDEVKAWQRLPEPYKASPTGVESEGGTQHDD